METIKKTLAILLAVLMIAACMTGCGQKETSDKAYVQGNGKLLVGITEYPPMDYKNENGEWIGFDADLCNMIGEKLGVEVEFVVLSNWGQKFQELDTKNVDMLCNGMTITEEATLNSSVTNAYAKNAQVLVMNADVIGNYKDTDSIKDLAFAVENGSAGQALLTDLGITNMTALQDQAAALMEVAAGTSEACVVDLTIANAMTGEGTSYDFLASGLALSSEEFGISFRKGSDLTAEINKILADLKADGTLAALGEKYNVALAD